MADRFWRDDVIQPALNHNVEAAVAEQQLILASDPCNAHAYFALGTLSQFQGQVEQAIQQFQKSLELNSQSVAPHLSLGRIYAVRGDYAKAWQHARAAEALGVRELVELLERYTEREGEG